MIQGLTSKDVRGLQVLGRPVGQGLVIVGICTSSGGNCSVQFFCKHDAILMKEDSTWAEALGPGAGACFVQVLAGDPVISKGS